LLLGPVKRASRTLVPIGLGYDTLGNQELHQPFYPHIAVPHHRQERFLRQRPGVTGHIVPLSPFVSEEPTGVAAGTVGPGNSGAESGGGRKRSRPTSGPGRPAKAEPWADVLLGVDQVAPASLLSRPGPLGIGLSQWHRL